MRRRRPPNILVPLALTVICAMLGASAYGAWKELHAPIELPPAAGEALADPGTAPGGAALKFPTADSLTRIAERPLFSETRRPVEPASQATIGAEATAQLTEFVLTGTVLSKADGQRFVTLRPDDGSQDVSAAEGSVIQGWAVIGIEADRAVFRRGEIETTLMLQFATPVPADLMPAARPQPQQPEPSATDQQQAPPAAEQVSVTPE